MSLKTRLKNLEKITSNEIKDHVFIIVSAFGANEIEPPVIGYSHDGVRYMRLENESDGDLQERVKNIALEKTTRQDCGLKVAIMHQLNDDDSTTDS
jgi:hypothetical protein